MTRIIAGFAGSIRLLVPGAGTRPTSDRVREAIFSALEARDAITGCRVLDLYAGSGALGLEAASRGASSVTLVERAPKAVAACRKNAAAVERSAPAGGSLTVSVLAQPVSSFLSSSSGPWQLVFIDPPYDLPRADLERDLALLVPQLADDAIVVLERSSRESELAWPEGLELERRKAYGDTALYWLARV